MVYTPKQTQKTFHIISQTIRRRKRLDGTANLYLWAHRNTHRLTMHHTYWRWIRARFGRWLPSIHLSLIEATSPPAQIATTNFPLNVYLCQLTFQQEQRQCSLYAGLLTHIHYLYIDSRTEADTKQKGDADAVSHGIRWWIMLALRLKFGS